MAFTTIQGSGANDATSLVGTSGVDFASITTASSYFVGAQEAADTVGINTNLSNTTVKGGQGTDTITFSAGASLTNSFVNANSNNDSVGAVGATANLFTSTLQGGQGNDVLTLGTVSSSVVNGNKNADQITVATGTSSSIYGGQGVDNVTLNAGTHSNVLASGDADGDTIALVLGSTLTNVTLSGGQGNDLINGNAVMTAATGTVANGGDGIDTINFTTFIQAVSISGNNDGDIINSGTAADTVNGDAGNDAITNNGGTDTITGGTGNDTLTLTNGAISERLIQNTGDSTAATVGATGLTGAGVLQNTSTFVFGNGIDYVAPNMTVADRVQTSIAGATVLSTAAASNVTNLAAGNYAIIGTWDGVSTFTTDAGNDILFIQISGGNLQTAGNLGTTAMVIDNFGNANITQANMNTVFVQ